jgi:hypothetical protein
MNASSESGLWATVISLMAVDTDEDDILKILQHFFAYDSNGHREQGAPTFALRVTALMFFPPAALPAPFQEQAQQAEPGRAAGAGASAAATA